MYYGKQILNEIGGGGMKKFSCFLVLCLFISIPEFSLAYEKNDKLGFWFEGRVDGKKSQLVGWYERQLTDVFGVYGLVSLENEGRYRQAYAGITLKPLPQSLPWLQIGAGIGRERDEESSGVRRNLFVSVDAEKVYGFATYENGPLTGPWYGWNIVYHVDEKISVGAMQEKNLGLAPRIEYHIKKNLTVWGAAFRDRAVFAINIGF